MAPSVNPPTRSSRRSFLVGSAALALTPLAAARLAVSPRGQAPAGPFRWGVASFDPTTDGVLLWTRLDPDAGVTDLRCEVAADDAFVDVTASIGPLAADASSDHCVRVEVSGLRPGTTYWYRFSTEDGATSVVGRTRTVPDEPDRLRLGLVACARYASGGYAAYRALADRDVDLVVHVGDYIYEDGGADARAHEPARRCTSLADYRARYALGRSDPDLQALHARHPMVHTWDDHESAGNAWRDGAVSHDDDRDGPWVDRLAAASQAHAEWLPGRTERSPDGRARLWRTLPLGTLADLVVLDTRTWGRARQARTAEEFTAEPDRELLGRDQAAWLTDQLRSPARKPWVLLANQVMFHPLQIPSLGDSLDGVLADRNFLVADDLAFNPDQWDGYPSARPEVLDAAGERGGVVVLTGDVHSSWAWNGPVARDGAKVGLVEIVAPSVSTASFASRIGMSAGLVEPALRMIDSDLAFVDLANHGYVVVDLTPDRVQGEWWFVHPDDVTTQSLGAALASPRSAPMRLVRQEQPTADRTVPRAEGTSTSTAAPPERTDGDGGGIPTPLVVAGGATAAVVGASLALRRRSEPNG